MALVNDFSIWASGGSAVYDQSQNLDTNHTGYLSGEKIYARTMNGILKDVSIVTVSLLAALLSTTTADTSSMTFNNDQTLADMQAQFESLLTTRNVATATKWQTQRIVNIKNGSGTILATATGVDGTANINLQFSSVVDISISGNATTATTTTNVGKTNVSAVSTIHYLAGFNDSSTSASSAVKVFSSLGYRPDTNTISANISGNAATAGTATTASKAQKVSIGAFGNCAATASPQNYVTINAENYPNNVPAIYTVTMVWKNSDQDIVLADIFNVKHDGVNTETDGVFALNNSTGGTIYVFRLRFSTIASSGTYTATLQYSSDGGSNYSDTGRELILRLDRQVCY